MTTERNLINELKLEEIFNKIEKNKKAESVLNSFQFEINNMWLTENNRLAIVHHFENMKKIKNLI